MFEEVQKEGNRQFSNNIRQRLDEAIQKNLLASWREGFFNHAADNNVLKLQLHFPFALDQE
ncbi:hypothetical protein PMEGAPR236_26650 [Priestia megaterium]